MQQRRLVILVIVLLGIAVVTYVRLGRESDEVDTTLGSAASVTPKVDVRRARFAEETPASEPFEIAMIRDAVIERLSSGVQAEEPTLVGVVIRGNVRNVSDDRGVDAAVAVLPSDVDPDVARPLEVTDAWPDGRFEIKLREPGFFLVVIAPRQSESLFRPVTRTASAPRPGDVVDLATIAVSTDHFVRGRVSCGHRIVGTVSMDAELRQPGRGRWGLGAVELTRVGDSYEIARLRTDVAAEADGRYALFGLAPLPYTIAAHPHRGGFGNVHDEIRAAARTVATPSQDAVDFDLSGCEFLFHCVDKATRMPVDGTACFIEGKGGWGGGPFPAGPNSVILRRGAEYGFRVEHADYERFATSIKTPAIGDTLEFEVELQPKAPRPVLVVRVSGAAATEIRELWATFEGLGAPAIAWWRPEGTFHTCSISAERDAEGAYRFQSQTPPAGRYRVRFRADGPLDGFGAAFARPSMIADMSAEIEFPTAGEVFVDIEAKLNGVLCFTIPWRRGEEEPSAEMTVFDAAGERVRCEIAHDMFGGISANGDQSQRTRYMKPALPAGAYTITATFADGRKQSATVTIEPGKTATATF